MSATSTAYHHGALRAALLDAGLAAARTGGPEALGLRALTRRVGVSPNAAYRHFADRRSLQVAVALRCQDLLAQTMRRRVARETAAAETGGAVGDAARARARAVARLRGVGLGYLEFARAETGWFATAYLSYDEPDGDRRVVLEKEVPPPFRMLLEALDHLVEVGVLDAARRPAAEWPCWSAVHGFADISTRGPLGPHPDEVIEPLGRRVIDDVVAGVLAPGLPPLR